jgi:DNA-binding PadR family transcriptional regulator
MEDVRVTVAVATLLRVFLDDVNQPHYGYDLMRRTGFPSGKLYPILARLHKAGWLVRERERAAASADGRPVRYLYRLSAEAVGTARNELAVLGDRLRPAMGGAPRPQPQGGSA